MHLENYSHFSFLAALASSGTDAAYHIFTTCLCDTHGPFGVRVTKKVYRSDARWQSGLFHTRAIKHQAQSVSRLFATPTMHLAAIVLQV